MDETLKRILELMGTGHGSRTELADYLGVHPNVITNWKSGRNRSYTKHLPQIADYFGVSVDYLHGKTDAKKTPTLTEKDERDIARDLESIMTALEKGGDMMFDGDPMSDEARDSIIAAMKLGLQAAKAKNKERFTPNKYRKE